MDVSYRRDKDHNYMILDAPGELTGENVRYGCWLEIIFLIY